MFEFLGLNKEEPSDFQKFQDIMDSRSVRKEVTSVGNVQIIGVNKKNKISKNDNDMEYSTCLEDEFDDKANENSNIISVVGCIFQRDGTIKNLQQELEFDENASKDVVDQLN